MRLQKAGSRSDRGIAGGLEAGSKCARFDTIQPNYTTNSKMKIYD
jgi:hypothetical protein